MTLCGGKDAYVEDRDEFVVERMLMWRVERTLCDGKDVCVLSNDK